jgi:RNA polymerase sigma factor (sigma-70 family)
MASPDHLRLVVHRLAPPTDEPDRDLLARFARDRDEAAFAELVRRHGPMVLAVCRRVLGCPHDADDAFQAAFLVLARRAGVLRLRGSVGDWMHGVACRTAAAARRAAARRRAREAAHPLASLPPPQAPADDLAELRAVLDEEVARLPEKYRAVLVLADLQQKDRRQVAAELGVAEGTVASRQSRARSLLAGRLSRRGWGLPAYLAAAGPAVVPAALAAAAVGHAAGGVTGSGPDVLAREVVAAMTRKKLAVAGALVLAAVAVGGGLAVVAADGPGPGRPAEKGYTVHAAGNSTLLLDAATGDTWVLSQPAGKDPAWVPVRRPAPTPPPAADAPAAKPPETHASPAVAMEIGGHLALAQMFRVHPRAAGTVARVVVRAGEAVKAGQLLVELDDADARLDLAAAEAGLAAAEVEGRVGAANPALEARRAEAKVQRARVEVARAKAALQATRLTAPADGTVVEVNTAAGDLVAPGGAPVVVVAPLRRLFAQVDVPERVVGRVSVGQACEVRLAAGGPEYRGQVTQVASVVAPETATVRVHVAIKVPDDAPAPRAGSFVIVRLVEKK